MKRISTLVLFFLLAFALGETADATEKRKIIQPKECRTSNYTCILKKNDGVPFFCVRTAKQRQQNARKSIRIVTRHNCIRRYPVEYEDEGPDQRQSKD